MLRAHALNGCTAPMVRAVRSQNTIWPTPRTPAPHIRRALPGTSAVPDLPVEKDDLPGYLAVLGLAIGKLSSARFSMTPELLYSSLAVYQLVYCVLSVIEGKVMVVCYDKLLLCNPLPSSPLYGICREDAKDPTALNL